MQTLTLSATSVYTLSPTRNVGELQAKLAKFTGYSGDDSFETVEECVVIDFPVRIDARELQGAELDAAYAEFAFAA